MPKELSELGRLKVQFALPYKYIKTLQIKEAADQHGKMHICLISSKPLTTADVLPLQDEPITITDPDGDIIFTGIAQSINLANEAGYSEIIIDAKTLSSQTDQKKLSRTFQNTEAKISQIANIVMAAYNIKVQITKDRSICQMLYQNNETDWQFLKRIANQNGMHLFTDAKAENMRISIGAYPFARKQLGAETTKKKPDVKKDIIKYLKIKENINPEAQPYEFR